MTTSDIEVHANQNKALCKNEISDARITVDTILHTRPLQVLSFRYVCVECMGTGCKKKLEIRVFGKDKNIAFVSST